MEFFCYAYRFAQGRDSKEKFLLLSFRFAQERNSKEVFWLYMRRGLLADENGLG